MAAQVAVGRLDGVTRVPVVLDYDAWVKLVPGLKSAPTPDDVPITRDGRRLDSKEKVLALLAEVRADVEARHRLVEELG
jgi:hypothetical protein